jgi:hypothetical protein
MRDRTSVNSKSNSQNGYIFIETIIAATGPTWTDHSALGVDTLASL